MNPGGLNSSHTDSLVRIVQPFSTAELKRLVESALKANINQQDFLVLNAVLTDPDTKVAEVYRSVQSLGSWYIFSRFL